MWCSACSAPVSYRIKNISNRPAISLCCLIPNTEAAPTTATCLEVWILVEKIVVHKVSVITCGLSYEVCMLYLNEQSCVPIQSFNSLQSSTPVGFSRSLQLDQWHHSALNWIHLCSDRPVCLCLCPCLPHFSLVFRTTDPWAGVVIINSVQR